MYIWDIISVKPQYVCAVLVGLLVSVLAYVASETRAVLSPLNLSVTYEELRNILNYSGVYQ